jgi:regulator of protease activity HflC (stomatin/prohibitin superfamily)
VWRSGLSGQAALKRAEQEKQIMIETAKAEVESAKLRAEAIALVGEAAQQYPEYRQQEFIAAFGEAIQSGDVEQIIYVPTEANIPIVEAGRTVGE